MRKIEFRGKTLKDHGLLPAGSWVYGGYYVDYCYGGCPEGKHYIVTWNSTGLGFEDFLRVNPETVGQYTGLKDKNGNPIFEGDIVKLKLVIHTDCSKQEVEEVKYYEGEIVWYRNGWAIKHEDGYLLLYAVTEDDEFEILGNVHENIEQN